ncbi:MAG TPA: Ig-like domain-containing protein, partial [Kofleriaceae bacterium]|nr:Ig-like domain-containing protein [Kofleriaceae bacterium]
MRVTRLLPCLLLLAAACGDNKLAAPDASRPDAAIDAAIDAPIAPPILAGIAEARATADGTGLDLPIRNVVITYLKPQIGSLTNDPAGFTIQAVKNGPALFVSVDPATLTPPAAVGDVVSFQINTMGTVALQRRAQAISSYTRVSTGAGVAALVQDISAATDAVTMVDSYDSEIVKVTGTLFENFASSGSGFQRSAINTAGITGDTNFQLRVPATLVDAIDMVMGCQVTAAQIPMGRFNAQAQLGVFSASDLTMTGCPAPVVTAAAALSPTSVRISFSRRIAAASVAADGSQFTFTNGITATAASVSGRTVTITTTAQAIGTNYTVTAANTVTDLQSTPVGTPSTGTFGGFVTPAVVRINEVNANITGGCDLIELRVVSGGSMTGFKIQERNGGSGELALTFP